MKKVGGSFTFSGEAPAISDIKALVVRIPEGKALLDLAAENRYAIAHDPNLTKHRLSGNVDHSLRLISLNPDTPPDEQIRTLCHELRHLWQCTVAPALLEMNDFTYAQNVAVLRLIEADAFVFEGYMSAKISADTGYPMPFEQDPDHGRGPFRYDACDNVDPLTPTGQRALFERFQLSNHAREYDRQMLENLKDAVAARPAALRSAFNGAAAFGQSRKITAIGGLPYLSPGDRFLDSLLLNTHVPSLRSGQKLLAELKSQDPAFTKP